jgi:hypothetical protein
VPITGTSAGDVVGGRRSGWLAVSPGTTTLDLDQPRNTVAPVIAGAPTVGSALTATDGAFTATIAPVITSRQWQRSTPGAGDAWTSIPGATSATYVVTTADRGQFLRFVTTAANRRATWGMGLSAPLAIPGPVVAPPPPVTAPRPAPGASGTVAPPQAATATAAAAGPVAAAPATATAGSAAARAAFTCGIKRGARVSLACTVRDASGGLRSARIRAVRGGHVVAMAAGRVRHRDEVPVLRLRRLSQRQDTRITITVRRADGRLRSMTRMLRI